MLIEYVCLTMLWLTLRDFCDGVEDPVNAVLCVSVVVSFGCFRRHKSGA